MKNIAHIDKNLYRNLQFPFSSTRWKMLAEIKYYLILIDYILFPLCVH